MKRFYIKLIGLPVLVRLNGWDTREAAEAVKCEIEWNYGPLYGQLEIVEGE